MIPQSLYTLNKINVDDIFQIIFQQVNNPLKLGAFDLKKLVVIEKTSYLIISIHASQRGMRPSNSIPPCLETRFQSTHPNAGCDFKGKI